jgi:hypothetical protein
MPHYHYNLLLNVRTVRNEIWNTSDVVLADTLSTAVAKPLLNFSEVS